jgi:hypothetical protein
MARKQDKLRPYRVDYFNIDEMKDNDLALVRSVVLRAVTSAEAAGKLLADNDSLPIVLIRSYRFYKALTHKRDVYKPIEELFTEKNALVVMDEVEKYRANLKPAFDRSSSVIPSEGIMNSTLPQDQKDRMLGLDPNGHQTRFSDSSLYDEVCNLCGATDTSGKLDQPCPVATAPDHATPDPAYGVERATFYKTNAGTQVQPPSSGPDSPATVAVVADLNGMLAHDEHEQVMDTFVPAPGQPDISKYADKTALPPDHPDHVCTDACYDVIPLGHGDDIAAAFASYNKVFPNPAPSAPCDSCSDLMPGAADLRPAPTWQKILLFAGMLGVSLLLLWLIFPHK